MAKIDWLKLENRIRATPLDLLGQGLENGQWEAVSLCYTMLTGKVIPPPEAHINIIGKEDKSSSITVGKTDKQEKVVTLTEEELSFPADNIDYGDEDEEEEEIQDEEYDEEEEEEEDVHRTRSKIRVANKTVPVNARGKKNKFVDDGVTAQEDNAFLPKAETLLKSRKHKRPGYKKIPVVCSKCGSREKVDPMLAPVKLDGKYKTKYVCNDCSCSGG
jgi:hypothetical protein